MKDIWKRLASILDHTLKTIQPIAPAIVLGALVYAVLAGYTPPKAEQYKVAAADVDWESLSLFKEDEEETEAAQDDKELASGSFELEDGTYHGSAQGYGGQISVDVTIKGRSMTAIDIVSAPGETEPFFTRAKGVVDSMLMAQSTKVDVVSGATYSSNGIIGAVENALYGTVSNQNETAPARQTGPAPSVSKVDESGTYKDGTYTGSAKGFGGMIKVQVTIKNGKIADIKILSAAGETASFFNRAKSLTKTIVSRQTTNVSAVSGATYSSNGIINAVRSALNKARTGAKKEETAKKISKKKKNTKKDKKAAADPSEYEDGTYEGTAQGFGGPVKVKVTIKDGKITKVKIVSAAKETEEYLKKARELTKTIVSRQTADVDVVTGATYSSNGIINTVKNALSKAKKKKTEQKEDSRQATTKTDEPTAPASEDALYNDGTYKGTGEGFDGAITLSVTIKDGMITAINIVSSGDDEAFFNRAKNGILSAVIEKQSTDVDVVSGASYSSEGILSAIRDALNKAKKTDAAGTKNDQAEGSGGQTTGSKDDTSPDGKEDTSTEGSDDSGSGKEDGTSEDKTSAGSGNTEGTTESKDNTGQEQGDGEGKDKPDAENASSESTGQETASADKEDTEESKSVYRDGTYTVKAACNPDADYMFDPYTIKMNVTIQSDRIVSIDGLEVTEGDDEDNDSFLNSAKKKVIPGITSKGSPEGVDAASGATCSSRAIMEGCRKALEQAKR